ncbi:MAG TPA: C2 family cysteine protease [Pyrinomonadaceae bacterium]|nr:C2 family cysteine protease [Pyrinomonadaceae bacterium]
MGILNGIVAEHATNAAEIFTRAAADEFTQLLDAERATLDSLPSETAFAERNEIAPDFVRRFFESRFEAFSVNQGGSTTAADKKNPCDNCGPLSGPVTTYVTGAGDGGEVSYNDVSQGGLNNCFVMASVAAVARTNPDAIRNMIQENRNERGEVISYTVTFHQKEDGLFGLGGGFKEVKVTVDANFPTNGKHANPGDRAADGTQEIWPLVIEKAFAQLRGGYANIDKGGSAHEVMTALTGRDAEWKKPSDYTFKQLSADFAAGRAVVFDTTKGIPAELATKYGLVGWHSYVATRVYSDKSGQWVELYNPWGPTAQQPTRVPYSEAAKIFSGINVVTTK